MKSTMKYLLVAAMSLTSNCSEVLAQPKYNDYIDEGLELSKADGLSSDQQLENHAFVFSKKEIVFDVLKDIDPKDEITVNSYQTQDQLEAMQSKYNLRNRRRGWLNFKNLTALFNMPVPIHHVAKAANIPLNNDVLMRITAVAENQNVAIKEMGFRTTDLKFSINLLRSYGGVTSSQTTNAGREKFLSLMESLLEGKSAGDRIKIVFKAELYNQKTEEVLMRVAEQEVTYRIPANPYYYKDNYFYSTPVITRFWKKQIDENHALYQKFQENINDPGWKAGYLPNFESLIGAIHLSHDNDFCKYNRPDYDGLGIAYQDSEGQVHYIELFPAIESDEVMAYYQKYNDDNSELEWQFHDNVVFYCRQDPNDSNSEFYQETLYNQTALELHPDLFKEVATPEGVKPSARERAEARQREFKRRQYEKNK